MQHSLKNRDDDRAIARAWNDTRCGLRKLRDGFERDGDIDSRDNIVAMLGELERIKSDTQG